MQHLCIKVLTIIALSITVGVGVVWSHPPNDSGIPATTYPGYVPEAGSSSVYSVPQDGPVHLANRSMMPTAPLISTPSTTPMTEPGKQTEKSPAAFQDTIPAPKPESKFTAYFGSIKSFFSRSKPKETQPQPKTPLPDSDRAGRLLPDEPMLSQGVKSPDALEGTWYPPEAKAEMPAPMTSYWPWGEKNREQEMIDGLGGGRGDTDTGDTVRYDQQGKKTSWFSFRSKDQEKKDDGLDHITKFNRNRTYSEKDYIESATHSTRTTAKDAYNRGMLLESHGDQAGATASYYEFIRANKTQTENGTLAAPYHRLALIAWREQDQDKSTICFQYALRYARGGTVSVIADDYSRFLIQRGKADQAEVILRNTLLHFPDDKRLQVSFGRCLAHLNKPVEGLRYLTDALGEERAYEELAVLYTQRGEYEWAEHMDRKRQELLVRRLKTHQRALPPGSVPSPVIPPAPPQIGRPQDMLPLGYRIPSDLTIQASGAVPVTHPSQRGPHGVSLPGEACPSAPNLSLPPNLSRYQVGAVASSRPSYSTDASQQGVGIVPLPNTTFAPPIPPDSSMTSVPHDSDLPTLPRGPVTQ